MISKSLCTLGLASLFGGALADNVMARFATDDNTVNQYCNVDTAPQVANFVCFRYSSNIRDHMTSIDPSAHGYVNAAGTIFIVMFDGQTEAFSTDRMDVIISYSVPCPEVSTLDGGGQTREYQGCPWTQPILIF